MRLKPLVGFSDIKFFYRLKASQNLKEISSSESKLYPINNFPLNFEIKNNKVAEFYKDDINADIDWMESEFKKCILIPTTMGQTCVFVYFFYLVYGSKFFRCNCIDF